MASTLLALPVEIVSENPEAAQSLANETQRYRSDALARLGLERPRETIATGGKRGSLVFDWTGADSLILHTAFLLPAGVIQAKEWIRVATLVRQSDCLHLGSVWQSAGSGARAGGDAGTSELSRSLPPSLLKGGGGGTTDALRSIAARSPARKSVVRFVTSAQGPSASRMRLLTDAVGGEMLAARGLPVSSSIARLVCTVAAPGTVGYPAKPHRTLTIRLTQSGGPKRPPAAWPWTTGRATLHSGVFGEPVRTAWSGSTPETFDPSAIVERSLAAIDELTHVLSEQTFRVIKRTGRWVFLDRGRAYGLEAGMHLVGPGKSALHVIHFTPAEGADAQKTDSGAYPDVAVALVRNEDARAPVRAGDVLTFDLTQFPMRKQ